MYGNTNIRILYFCPKRQILDSSKLEECADDSFKFDENGRKFSYKVANTVGKGEIVFTSIFSFS